MRIIGSQDRGLVVWSQVGLSLVMALLALQAQAQGGLSGVLGVLGAGEQPRDPIIVPGIPGLPAVPLPALPLPSDPIVIGNPGLPLLPDPIVIVNPDDLPSELQVPDPLLIVDPDNIPNPLLPGLPALPGLPDMPGASAGVSQRDSRPTQSGLEYSADSVLGLPLPSSTELRAAIDAQVKQPLSEGAAQLVSVLPAQTPLPIPADALAALVSELQTLPDAPIRFDAAALVTLLGQLDQTQIQAAAVQEAVDALLMVDPTTTISALEQLDAAAYLGRLSEALTPEQLAASGQVLAAYLQEDPLSGQMPARLIALALAANPLPVDTMGLQPLVLVQIAGNLMLAASHLPSLPVEGLELDLVAVRNDLFDAVNPLLATALGIDPASPTVLAATLQSAILALQAAAAAGVPSLLVPGVEVDVPSV